MGETTRNVFCMTSDRQNYLHETKCSYEKKPLTWETCIAQPCPPPRWTTGEWRSVSMMVQSVDDSKCFQSLWKSAIRKLTQIPCVLIFQRHAQGMFNEYFITAVLFHGIIQLGGYNTVVSLTLMHSFWRNNYLEKTFSHPIDHYSLVYLLISVHLSINLYLPIYICPHWVIAPLA